MLYSHEDTNKKDVKLSSKFQELPLRLPLTEVARVVDGLRLRCTHYDAIRFFPPDANRLNGVQPPPTRQTSVLYEQSGCIHVNMDLLK